MSGKLCWSGEAGPGLVWPTAPEPGRKWGLFAPAHHFEAEEFARARLVLTSWGVETSWPKNIFRRQRYLAGSDQFRLDFMDRLMMDPEVAGLLAVRGGSGCQRLLPLLANRWTAWPTKPIIGFSDLTALHLGRLAAVGVIGYHGPMLISLGKINPADLVDTCSQADLRWALRRVPFAGGWTFQDRDVLKPGRARGPLLGGNLTLLIHLLTSPWLPDFTGAILLVEDADEYAYRLDRLLISLRQSYLWLRLSGLVFGRFIRCGSPALVRALLKEAAEDFSGPVLMNAPVSHGGRNRLFPLGALAALTAI